MYVYGPQLGMRGIKLTFNFTAIEHSITYSVVSAEPALSYSSVVSKITLSPVTSGSAEGSTYIQWSGNYSSDAGKTSPNPLASNLADLLPSPLDAGVIEDARFKRKEALASLASSVSA